MGCSNDALRNLDDYKRQTDETNKNILQELKRLKKEISDKCGLYEKRIRELENQKDTNNKNAKQFNEKIKIFENEKSKEKLEIKNELSQMNKKLEKLKEEEIQILNKKVNYLEKEKELYLLKSEFNKNKIENNKRIDKIGIDFKDLKSQINDIKEKLNDQIELSQSQKEEIKNQNLEKLNKINNLENEIEKLKNEVSRLSNDLLNYKNENHKMEIESIDHLNSNEDNKTQRIELSTNNISGEKLSSASNDNSRRIYNNFFQPVIINICFRMDEKFAYSVQAYPSDKLGDLFSRALLNNGQQFNWYREYKFFYDAKNVTGYFTNNESITSLNLKNNSIIHVYS